MMTVSLSKLADVCVCGSAPIHLSYRGAVMARNQHTFAKRQREEEKKRKAAEKRERRLSKKRPSEDAPPDSDE